MITLPATLPDEVVGVQSEQLRGLATGNKLVQNRHLEPPEQK